MQNQYKITNQIDKRNYCWGYCLTLLLNILYQQLYDIFDLPKD